MNTEKLLVSLTPAEADPPLRSTEYQQGLEKLASSLTAQGVGVSNRIELEEAAGSETVLLGSFTIELVKAILPVLGTVVGAWLHAKYGRKVRLKFGDIDAEATTVEEVEKPFGVDRQEISPTQSIRALRFDSLQRRLRPDGCYLG